MDEEPKQGVTRQVYTFICTPRVGLLSNHVLNYPLLNNTETMAAHRQILTTTWMRRATENM